MDIATVYSYNITGFGYKNLHESQINNIKVLKGDFVNQHSFDLFEDPNDKKIKETPSMDLSLKTCWKAIGDVRYVKFRGRIIGGCLDSLLDIVGTKYDYTRNFINKYKMESIPPRRSGCAISKALPGLRGDRDAEGQAYLSFVSFEAFACQIAGLSEMWIRSLE